LNEWHMSRNREESEEPSQELAQRIAKINADVNLARARGFYRAAV